MRVAPDARRSSIVAGVSAGSARWTCEAGGGLAVLGPQRLVVLDDLAADQRPRQLGQLGGRRALEADEHVPGRPGVLDAGRRQRLEHDRIGGLGDDGAGRSGQRVQADAHPHDLAQPARRADRQPRQVVAGDVLDDPAAAVDDGAVGQPQRHAEQQVARRAVAVRARSGDRRRERLGDREPLGAGRVERQHLPALRQRAARARPSVTAPSTTAVRSPGSCSIRSVPPPPRARADGAGTGRAPRRTAGAWAGASRGCRARRGRRPAAAGPSPARSALREHPRHRAHLVDADPVLAGERPARLDAGVEDLGGQPLGALRLALDRGVVEHERVQVAVAGVEHVSDARARSGPRAPRSAAASAAGACAGRRRPGRSSRG